MRILFLANLFFIASAYGDITFTVVNNTDDTVILLALPKVIVATHPDFTDGAEKKAPLHQIAQLLPRSKTQVTVKIEDICETRGTYRKTIYVPGIPIKVMIGSVEYESFILTADTVHTISPKLTVEKVAAARQPLSAGRAGRH